MQSAKQLYLDLLKRCLSNVIYQDPSTIDWSGAFWQKQE